jgi:hypothetical protein
MIRQFEASKVNDAPEFKKVELWHANRHLAQKQQRADFKPEARMKIGCAD